MSFCSRFAAAALAGAFLLGCVAPAAHAQLSGHNFKGDFGLQSGSQPDPGFYLAGMYLRYDGDSLRDRDGNKITLDPEESGSLASNSFAVGIWWITNWEVFGANYGAMAFPAITNSRFEAPILGLEENVDMGFTDLYVQPINLGWHTSRADYSAGFGLFMPTGRYEPGADDNLGLGMWSYELYAGTTIFFDDAHTWDFAATAFFEMHSEKKDTDIRVGNLLTLEGGLGKSFMDGAANIGIAYYAQIKVSADDFGSTPIPPELEPIPKSRVWGLGPELNLPIATKSTFYGVIGARYLWEFGARATLQGRTLAVTATFPIPSIGL